MPEMDCNLASYAHVESQGLDHIGAFGKVIQALDSISMYNVQESENIYKGSFVRYKYIRASGLYMTLESRVVD